MNIWPIASGLSWMLLYEVKESNSGKNDFTCQSRLLQQIKIIMIVGMKALYCSSCRNRASLVNIIAQVHNFLPHYRSLQLLIIYSKTCRWHIFHKICHIEPVWGKMVNLLGHLLLVWDNYIFLRALYTDSHTYKDLSNQNPDLKRNFRKKLLFQTVYAGYKYTRYFSRSISMKTPEIYFVLVLFTNIIDKISIHKCGTRNTLLCSSYKLPGAVSLNSLHWLMVFCVCEWWCCIMHCCLQRVLLGCIIVWYCFAGKGWLIQCSVIFSYKLKILLFQNGFLCTYILLWAVNSRFVSDTVHVM